MTVFAFTGRNNDDSADVVIPSHDSATLYAECSRLGIDCSWWIGLANTCKLVAGRKPSECYLLLSRKYIVGDANATPPIPAINVGTYDHKITIIDGQRTTPIELKGWVFHSAHAITGSEVEADGETIYLVKFVDCRFLFARQPYGTRISGALLYNVRDGLNIVSMIRSDSGMTYDYADTTNFPYILSTANGGSSHPYSWLQVLQILWKSSSFLDNTGFTMGIVDDSLPSGGLYPTQTPIDVHPGERNTWDVFCDLLHAAAHEIYPALDGTFTISPIDAHFNQATALIASLGKPIETGHPRLEERRLPEAMTMTFRVRQRDTNSELTNQNKFWTLAQPIQTVGSDNLITNVQLTGSGMTVAGGQADVAELNPGVLENVNTSAMTAVFTDDSDPRNGDALFDFAQTVLSRLVKSRYDYIHAIYDRFIALVPCPEFEEVIFACDARLGPITSFRSIPANIGSDYFPDMGGTGSSTDRLVAADTTDDTPGTLFDKLLTHGTYDSMTDLLVKADVVTSGVDPNNDNDVRLFVTAASGGTGPPGSDGADGTNGTNGTDGDTVTEGYAIDVAHAGTVATVTFDPTEITGYAAAFQFFSHLAGDAVGTPEGPSWKTVSAYNAGLDQFWWHRSGSFTFQTTATYDPTKKQQLINDASNWKWLDAWTIKVTINDTTPSVLHDAVKDNATYVSGQDGLVASTTDGAGGTDQKERFFLDVSAISGWVSGNKQALTHTNTGQLLWADILTCADP